jgi:hypothetical protein
MVAKKKFAASQSTSLRPYGADMAIHKRGAVRPCFCFAPPILRLVIDRA